LLSFSSHSECSRDRSPNAIDIADGKLNTDLDTELKKTPIEEPFSREMLEKLEELIEDRESIELALTNSPQ
jgi:hypothetical protein